MKPQFNGWRALLLAIGLVAYAGVLWEPAWSTVEDGRDLAFTLEVRQQIAAGYFPGTSLVDNWASQGTFRPGFNLLRLIEFELFGFDCWKHHAVRLLLLLGGCQLLFSMTTLATGSGMAAFLTAVLFMLFSPNVEIWFRLTEHAFYPTVLAILSLACLVRCFTIPSESQRLRWSVWLASNILIAPAYFIKECTVTMTGVSAAVVAACWLDSGALFGRRNLRLSVGYFGVQCGLTLLFLMVKSFVGVAPVSAGSYTSNYQCAPAVLAATAFKYADVLWNGFQLLTPIALAVFCHRLWLRVRGRCVFDAGDGLALIGLCWFGSVLALMLPWKSPAARYLAYGVPGLSLFTGICIWRLFSDAAPQPSTQWYRWRKLGRWVVLGNLALLPFIALVRNYNYLIFRHDFDRTTFAMIETVAAQAAPHSRLYMNFPADARFFFNEMIFLLDVLFQRTDVTQFNYNAPVRPDARGGDLFLTFVREPEGGRSMEASLPASFHHDTLKRLEDRLELIQEFRASRNLLNSYPDAPVFNWAARSGIHLPEFLGMHKDRQRSLFAYEPSLVEWRLYRFKN